MAEWVNRYLQGSFRGVTFFINRHDYESGRRLATHAFPEKEDVEHEDLGRSERSFNLSAYIIGGDYFQHREDLINALEAKGTGRLVHPYRGIFEVVCSGFRETENTREGRIARFDLSFKEQKVVFLTTEVKNTSSEIRTTKFNLLDQINAAFAEAYSITNAPVAAVQDALDAIDHGLTVVEGAKKVVGSYAEFQREISNVRGKAIQLSLDGADLAASFQDVVEFGTDPLGEIAKADSANANAQILEMANIAQDSSQPESSSTPPDIYNDPDYPAKKIQVMIQQQAIASASGMVSVTPLTTIQDAENLRTTLFDIFNQILENPNTEDSVFEAIRDAKEAVNSDLDRRILDLARVVSWKLVEGAPSLVVSNEIYGNLEKEQEIIDRNAIQHPGFISAGVELQVEIDG